jgi:hypothetical protein
VARRARCSSVALKLNGGGRNVRAARYRGAALLMAGLTAAAAFGADRYRRLLSLGVRSLAATKAQQLPRRLRGLLQQRLQQPPPRVGLLRRALSDWE